MAPRIDRASRTIGASAARIHAAFVDPDVLVKWLPPQGARGRIEAFEPRPGGRFRMTLTFDAAAGKTTGDTDVVEGLFVEIEPARRIVQRFEFVSEDPAFAGAMTMTWTFAPTPEGTRVSVRAEGVPAGITPADHEAGMASSLANLAAAVEKAEP